MKPVLTSLLTLLLAAGAVPQNPSAMAKPASRATIEGVVIKEPGSDPVKKALIELIAENQAEGGDYTALTGPDGVFHIEGIVPGRYRLFAERTGFLEVEKHHVRSEGRVLTLAAGQEVKDLQIRLQAAAVVRGRVTDEDGDPLANAQVGVSRQTFASGRSRWEQVGSERTNDLGEYRVAGLAAGNYYVSVSPPPDFKTLIEASGNPSGAETRNAAMDKSSVASYQTTYYPGTTDRTQATPIQLRAGDEFPVSFSLTPSPSLSIRGAVVNLPPRSSPVIMLQSRDFNVVLNGAEIHKDGTFVIRGVSPGAYTIQATVENVAAPMMARQAVQVSNNVEGVRLAPQPGGWIRGKVRFDSKASVNRLDMNQMLLVLRSVDGDDDAFSMMGEGFGALAHVAGDGSVEWKNVPPGNYYVQIAGETTGGDWYVKSVLASGRNADESGISVNGGTIALDLVASANGGMVEGVVRDRRGEPVANAVVVAAPEVRLPGRVDRYCKTVSDQSGRFTLRRVRPGDYTLFAWESVEGEAYYSPEFLKLYEGQGSALHVGEAERKTTQVRAIPEADAQE
jgi:carboxypeptidase family protein